MGLCLPLGGRGTTVNEETPELDPSSSSLSSAGSLGLELGKAYGIAPEDGGLAFPRFLPFLYLNPGWHSPVFNSHV